MEELLAHLSSCLSERQEQYRQPSVSLQRPKLVFVEAEGEAVGRGVFTPSRQDGDREASGYEHQY